MGKELKEYQKVNKERLAKANKTYSEAIKYYKEQAVLHRQNKKYKQEFAYPLYERLKAYIADVRGKDKPITTAGLILASGLTKDYFSRMKTGEFDHDLEVYLDSHDLDEIKEYDTMPYIEVDGEIILLVPLSEIIGRALLMMEDETETRLYESGRVGDIFALKAKHGWIEEEKAVSAVTNQTLIIASPKEAEEAIKMLK